jgi:hypothetical protein
MEDVRTLTTLLFTVELFSFLTFSSTYFLQPLMKEFIRLGTQFIGYRDYADNLKGIPLVSSYRVNFPLLFCRNIVILSLARGSRQS